MRKAKVSYRYYGYPPMKVTRWKATGKIDGKWKFALYVKPAETKEE